MYVARMIDDSHIKPICVLCTSGMWCVATSQNNQRLEIHYSRSVETCDGFVIYAEWGVKCSVLFVRFQIKSLCTYAVALAPWPDFVT